MRFSSYKVFLLVIGFIVLVSLACGTSAPPDPTATTPPQVEEEVFVPVVTTEEPVVIEEEIPTLTATNVPIRELPATQSVSEVVEEPEPPEDEPQAYFIEEFDDDLSSWSYFLMNGDENKMDLYTDYGRLVFDLQGSNQWVYVLYDEYYYSDVRIDVQAENLGKNTNNVSLICNYSDRFGWYEFNITNGGMYSILVYSEIDGDYFTLASGGSTNVRMGRDVNTYTAICQGNQLSLYVNGVFEREHVDTKYNLREGLVGVSVASFEVLPILVELEYFSISVP
jgi:hypothetical protein